MSIVRAKEDNTCRPFGNVNIVYDNLPLPFSECAELAKRVRISIKLPGMATSVNGNHAAPLNHVTDKAFAKIGVDRQ
jgi:hypothetical protein